MIDNWLVLFGLLLLVPILAYLTTKLTVYAFYKARWQFQRDHDCSDPYPHEKNKELPDGHQKRT